MSRKPAFWLAALLTCLNTSQCLADPSKVSPEPLVWSVAPPFSFASKPKKTRRSISGIACPAPSGATRLCVAAFDEGVEARFVAIDGSAMFPKPDRIVLLPNSDGELDAEAAAQDGDTIYIAGSHSPGRKNCEERKASRHVFRLVSSAGQIAIKDDDGSLWKLMREHAVLGKFVGPDFCPGSIALTGHKTQAVDIEGMAARNQQLYFGFRGPALNAEAYIARVGADALFSDGNAPLQLFSLKTAPGRSIRDLLAVPDGILILEGPDDDSPAVDWHITFWNGNEESNNTVAPVIPIITKDLAILDLSKVQLSDCDEELKPEAMTLLEDGANFRRILILSDGMCDGGPMSFQIDK
jgi:hypothetical protein